MSEGSRFKGVTLPPFGRQVPQIDLLKGLAIIAVLMLHALPAHTLFDSAAVLHIGQSVPVFALLMGLNAQASSVRRGATSLRGAYLPTYLVGRIERLYFPFLLVFVISMAAAIVRGDTRIGFLAGIVTGELATSGPGNYFIGFAFQFAVLAPALFLAYRRAPHLTVAVMLMSSAAFEVAASHVALFDQRPYFYASSILRFAPFIVIGMAMADVMLTGARISAWWLVGVAISVVYLVAMSVDSSILPLSTDDWRPWGQTVFSVLYPAALVVVGLRAGPARGAVLKLVAKLGRASYHIFLMQILWFALLSKRSVAIVPLDILAACALGYAFWALAEKLPRLAGSRAVVPPLPVASASPAPAA